MPALDDFLDRAAALVAEHVDLPRLRRIARPFGLGLYGPAAQPLRPLGQRIAVARDVAFAFAYPAVLDGWRAAGAESRSSLADEPPAASATAVYLPGGYPELHAARLAANRGFLDGLRAAADRGAFVYGECGGFMALGRSLVDRQGRATPWPGSCQSPAALQSRACISATDACLLATSPLGQAGTTRGHEFHYARLLDAGDAPPLFDVTDTHGQTPAPLGAQVGTAAGSFLHLIDRSAEPTDTVGRAGHLRVVE